MGSDNMRQSIDQTFEGVFMDTLIQYIQGLAPWVDQGLMILGSMVVIGQIYVSMTPSPEDDAAFNKLYDIRLLGDLLKAVAKFAVVQKKPKE